MQIKILWADDEIDLLKPHIMFLEQKGYIVETVNSGIEAIEKCQENQYDIVFLDENMPGISGLDALEKIKDQDPLIPIIMITKSEEEQIMEEAIGGKITDYLIKPVKPSQILLSLKKNLDKNKLVSDTISSKYQQEFREISMELSQDLDDDEWKSVFKRLVYWDIEFKSSNDEGLKGILEMQRKEANQLFSKHVIRNYENWLNDGESAPQMLHTLFKDKINSHLHEKVYLILIDNLRYDQWLVLKPLINKHFSIDEEEIIYSILPTATHYARNAFFAGLMPSEIKSKYPKLWNDEEDEAGKNSNEEEFLKKQLVGLGKGNLKVGYNKITNLDAGKKLVDNFNQTKNNDLNVIVYNFVDMLSHARTDMKVIKELAEDEAAYRSITESWFEHSPLQSIFKKIAESGAKVVLTTDHGTVKVTEPVKIVGPKSTNSNLRYKVARNLDYNSKNLFVVSNPEDIYLPSSTFASEFVFCTSTDFFVYPNNYNSFVNHFKNTFQHGGISLEEMMIPFAVLSPKK